MRSALNDPETQRRSEKKIATYRGGALTVAEFLRWMYALPPQFAIQLASAPDDQLTEVARIFTQNTILLEQADSFHVQVSPVEWAGIRQQFRAEIDSLRILLGFGGDLTDTSVTQAERAKLAALRVDTYLGQVTAGQTVFRRVPATLSDWLRQRGQYHLNQAGLIRAVELAQATKARGDSGTMRDTTHAAPPATGGTGAPGGAPPRPGTGG